MTEILAGRIALLTGGGRGIGAAIALELVSRGPTMALSYSISEAKAKAVVAKIEAAGGSAIALKVDQAIEREVVGLVATVVERFGKLDILINNAGVFEAGAIPDALDTSRFERQVWINYQAVVTAIREASRVIGEGDRIITLSSALAARSSCPASPTTAPLSRHRGVHHGRGPRPWPRDCGQSHRDWLDHPRGWWLRRPIPATVSTSSPSTISITLKGRDPSERRYAFALAP